MTNATTIIATTTALDLVMQQMFTSYTEYIQFITPWTNNITAGSAIPQQTMFNDTSVTNDDRIGIPKLLQTKLLRFIYCFGALLRGNYHAQQHLLLLSSSSSMNNRSSGSNKSLYQDGNDNAMLQQLMNHVIFPSLYQIHHHELVSSLHSTKNNSSSSSSSSSAGTTISTLPELQQQHIDFLYKFLQRALNVISDCVMEIQSNLQDNNENPKWSLQYTNPTQYQQLQTIDKLWHGVFCRSEPLTHSTTIGATSEERLLHTYSRSDHGNTMDLNAFWSSPIASMNHPNEIEELRSTVRSILDHCP
jgi:hypothetical protein